MKLTDSEAAVMLAAKEYARTGRAEIIHPDTPKIWDGQKAKHIASPGVDFHGGIFSEGVSTYFTADAKETAEASLPLSNIEEHQLETLRRNRAGISGLIVVFTRFSPAWRAYWLPIRELDQFYAAKWRESLSEDWCQAFGKVLPVTVTPSATKRGRLKRRIWFLDGKRADDADQAIARVNAERLAAEGRAQAASRSPAAGRELELFRGVAGPPGSTWPGKPIGHGALHPFEEPPPSFLAKSEKRLAAAKDGEHPLRGTAMDLLVIAKAARRRGLGKRR